MGAAHLAQMRQHFERLLGRKVRLVGERRDDVGAQLVLKDPKFDASLVPPRLLESVESFIIASSQAPAPDPKASPEDLTRDFRRNYDRAFMDEPVPALDGRTPRDAARDPVLRPKLIRLLKSRVRQQDEENLRTGRADDINWMLRELGTHEILFDPPPRRSPPPDQPGENEEADTDDPLEQALYRPLPKEPLTEEEARERLTAVMAVFDTAALAMKELKASGSNLLECSRDMAGDFLTDAEYSILMTFEIQAWFALVPPGSPAPRLDGKALAAVFHHELRRMQRLGLNPNSQSELFRRLLEQSRQPGLLKVLATALLNMARKQPADTRPQPITSLWMLLQLKVLLDALDQSVARGNSHYGPDRDAG